VRNYARRRIKGRSSAAANGSNDTFISRSSSSVDPETSRLADLGSSNICQSIFDAALHVLHVRGWQLENARCQRLINGPCIYLVTDLVYVFGPSVIRIVSIRRRSVPVIYRHRHKSLLQTWRFTASAPSRCETSSIRLDIFGLVPRGRQESAIRRNPSARSRSPLGCGNFLGGKRQKIPRTDNLFAFRVPKPQRRSRR